MANYVQRYIPGLTNIVKPLRDLTNQDAVFEWTSECEDAWSKLKEGLTNDTVMSYFDRELTTELVVDASPHGLGRILTQVHHHHDDQREVRIISYASRALAVRRSVEHFHLYLYGNNFSVITDHKSLVSVFGCNSMISKSCIALDPQIQQIICHDIQ